MVKTPNVRHSKDRRDPVTIDLEASRITPETDDGIPEAAVRGDESASDTGNAESPLLAEASEAALSEPAASLGDDAAPVAGEPQTTEPVGAGDGVPAEPVAETGPTDAGAFDRDTSAHTANSPPLAPPPSRRGGVSAVLGGIIGAIIALIGAASLQYGGLLPSPGSGATDTEAVTRLDAEIAGLKEQISALQPAGDGSAVQQSVTDLQGKVDTLRDDLDKVQKALESGGAGENAGLAALDAKIAEIQAQLQSAGGSGGNTDLGPINEKIAALESAIKDAADKAGAGDGRLTALEQSIAALTGKIDAQGDQPKIALSIAASALKSAVERGQPFGAELDTLAAISPDLPQLAQLRTYAEAGVATRDDLVAGMEAAANAMIAAEAPADENAGFLDQLWHSAASLVTVRPVGAVPGEGVPEKVARMEAALKAGDLGKALAEYDTLPDAPKAAGGAFAAKIKARLDVEKLVEQAVAQAMKSV